MSRNSRLGVFADQVGFNIEVRADAVYAVRVPCLFAGGVVGTCTIEASCDPATGKPDKRTGGDVHAVQIAIDGNYDGRVYNADGTPIGNYVGGDDKTWSNISIKKGWQGSPEQDATASDLIHRYAKHIVGAVWAAGSCKASHPEASDPFKIPNTFEARAGIVQVQDPIRGQSIAIIGLGGTGAYILDLLVKTPVHEIHVLDDDQMDWHNFMRAPGAPTGEEIESRHRGCLGKVDYYYPKYEFLRKRIHLHAIRVDSKSTLEEFLSEHPIDFAFVCIDQLVETDSPRQDVVYCALSEAEIPFIDSGVSIAIDNCAVSGAVTTSFYDAGSLKWKGAIPNSKVEGDAPGYRNVQLPEVNALAASLAVMEWRRRTGQYASKSVSFLHKFRLETPRVVTSN